MREVPRLDAMCDQPTKPPAPAKPPDGIGPLLPDRSADDDPLAWGDQPEDSDAWLRGQVPPHHGD